MKNNSSKIKEFLNALSLKKDKSSKKSFIKKLGVNKFAFSAMVLDALDKSGTRFTY